MRGIEKEQERKQERKRDRERERERERDLPLGSKQGAAKKRMT